MKAHQGKTRITTALRNGLLMAAAGFAFALPVHAEGEALEIEQPSMRSPTEPAPAASMSRYDALGSAESPVADGKVPRGEVGDKPEVIGARDESIAAASERLRIDTESHEVTPRQ